MSATAQTSETVRITLPSSTIEKYEKQSEARGDKRPAEWLMAERLRQFADQDATSPLVVNDEDRRTIERVLGRNFQDGPQLATAIRRMAGITLNGLDVTLSPMALERLKTRCIGMDFEAFVQRTVSRLLEEYVGLR